MTLTLAQTISALSKYSVGPGGDISSEDLAILKELVAGELLLLNPGFEGNDLVRLEAYLVLNAYESDDIGIRHEQIKDHSWSFANYSSGSHWMDAAKQFIASYRSAQVADFGIVERCDSEMRSMVSDQIKPETFGDVDTTYKQRVWNQNYN